MPGWTLVDTHPTQGRTFQRPLDVNEVVFLWHSLNGTGDSGQHAELRLVNGSRDAHLFSAANLARAWVSAKRRFPLVGATVRGYNAPLSLQGTIYSNVNVEGGGLDSGFASQPRFVVQEQALSSLNPREIVFGTASGPEDVRRQMTAIFNGPPPLSTDMLVQLHVFRHTDPKKTNVLNVVALFTHTIMDRLSADTFVRCFLDTLARGPGSEPAQVPLEDRLAMELPFVELEPTHTRSLSPAIRQWRRAVGAVMVQVRRRKLAAGGHTLPGRFTPMTLQTPARSGHVSTAFTHAQSATILANCHSHGLTLGPAYLALAQVAMTRVLYRHYLRGEISEEEWAYRQRQPHLILGPINLRPHLDKTWFEKGGGGEFSLSSNAFYYQLPCMALGVAPSAAGDRGRRILPDGAPPFPDLLTFDRFLHRSGVIKARSAAYFSHPVLFESVVAGSHSRVAPVRGDYLGWMKRTGDENSGIGGQGGHVSDVALPVAGRPMVWAFKGTSYGNLDATFPSEYPIPPSHPLSPYSPVPHPARTGYLTPPPPPPASTTPILIVESTTTCLHVSPAELYPGTSAYRGRLNLFVDFDHNVFEERVVKEWLDETREAVWWYLGQTHRPRSKRAGGEGARAKL